MTKVQQPSANRYAFGVFEDRDHRMGGNVRLKIWDKDDSRGVDIDLGAGAQIDPDDTRLLVRYLKCLRDDELEALAGPAIRASNRDEPFYDTARFSWYADIATFAAPFAMSGPLTPLLLAMSGICMKLAILSERRSEEKSRKGAVEIARILTPLHSLVFASQKIFGGKEPIDTSQKDRDALAASLHQLMANL